jgi:hypothetical protein
MGTVDDKDPDHMHPSCRLRRGTEKPEGDDNKQNNILHFLPKKKYRIMLKRMLRIMLVMTGK